jgi:hypothetical protein
VTVGFYILEDRKIIMTNRKGDPLRRSSGELYTHVLKDGENEITWAGILTKQARTASRGDRKEGFDGPLDYGPKFWH